jgi:hypothetical protein
VAVVRRILVILALLAALVGSAPADAHTCSSPGVIPVGQETTVTVGVIAEAQPVVGVTITVPPGFEATEVAPATGWKELPRQGPDIVLEGGPIQPFACGFFSLRGRATKKATLVFVATTRAADGTIERFADTNPGSRLPAQVVFAGLDPSDAGSGDGSSGSGVIVGLGVGLVAGIVAVLIVRRQRRQRTT